MGSASSASKKQETSVSPSYSDQNRTQKVPLADAIHSNSNLETTKGSREKMATGSPNTNNTSHPGKAVKISDKSTDTPGIHKTVLNVTKAVDQPPKDVNQNINQNVNQNAEVDKVLKESPKSRPRKEQKIISKINTALKRLDDGNVHEKLRLMEWLENRMKSLSTMVQPSSTKAVATNNDEEGEQNTDGDWSKLQEEIKAYKSTKQELLNVVSEIAGARLKNNNPAIADLSDKNRASKLAERFSELYDNEWTDVVEVLRTPNNGKKMTAVEEETLEEKCIHFMVELLTVTYENCQEKAKKDLKEMIDIIVKSPTSDASVDVSKRCKDFMKLQMSSGKESLQRVLKSVWGEVEKSADPEKKYSDFFKVLEKNRYYVRYRETCVELCWYMCLQDPPVVMMASITPASTKDHFRAYTRSGKFLGFVVWPALFLHENGPLLYKGVAQYTNKTKQPIPEETSVL